MTNAEKYLKEGVSAEEFVKAVWGSCYNIPEAEGDKNYKNCMMYGATIERWLNELTKPTLTEDERVILRNINKKFNRIERNKFGFLILTENGCEKIGEAMHTLNAFNHLFQFIKERRRI